MDALPIASVYPFGMAYELQDFVDRSAEIMARVYRTMAFNVNEYRVSDPLPIEYDLSHMAEPVSCDIEIRLVQHGDNTGCYCPGDKVFFAIAPLDGWGTSAEKKIEMPAPAPTTWVLPQGAADFLLEFPHICQWLIGVWENHYNTHEKREANHWAHQQAMVNLQYMNEPGVIEELAVDNMDDMALELFKGALSESEAGHWLCVDLVIEDLLAKALIPDWGELEHELNEELTDYNDSIDGENEEEDEEELEDFEARMHRQVWARNFVASLSKIELSDIPTDSRKCPMCWAQFGEADEDSYHNPPDNDPVKLPCGHLFGYDCLIETLSASSLCPLCRVELRT